MMIKRVMEQILLFYLGMVMKGVRVIFCCILVIVRRIGMIVSGGWCCRG